MHGRQRARQYEVSQMTTEFWACRMEFAACHPCGAHNVQVASRFLQMCGLVVKGMKDAVYLYELNPLPRASLFTILALYSGKK